MRYRVSVLLTVFLASCAPITQRIQVDDVAQRAEARKQNELALHALIEDNVRLQRVGYPILTRAVAMCKDKIGYGIGAGWLTTHRLPEQFREIAADTLKLGSNPRVIYLLPGSPAEKAGLKTGDEIVAFNKVELKPDDSAVVETLNKQLDETGKAGKEAIFTLSREGVRVDVAVKPEKRCGYPIRLQLADIVNAFADGNQIIITRGMLRFAQSDTELALVIAHELAHNAMGHMKAKMGNFLLGSIVDILFAAGGVNTQGTFGNLASMTFSEDFEAEADYVGLYMMAQAGLDIENAPVFWRRMAVNQPGAISNNQLIRSHPATPYRMLALEKAVQEIREKQKSGKPLEPEMKRDLPKKE